MARSRDEHEAGMSRFPTLMSLRDWFAGQALAGYLAMHADPEVNAPKRVEAAKMAYEYADAMLEARRAG